MSLAVWKAESLVCRDSVFKLREILSDCYTIQIYKQTLSRSTLNLLLQVALEQTTLYNNILILLMSLSFFLEEGMLL